MFMHEWIRSETHPDWEYKKFEPCPQSANSLTTWAELFIRDHDGFPEIDAMEMAQPDPGVSIYKVGIEEDGIIYDCEYSDWIYPRIKEREVMLTVSICDRNQQPLGGCGVHVRSSNIESSPFDEMLVYAKQKVSEILDGIGIFFPA